MRIHIANKHGDLNAMKQSRSVQCTPQLFRSGRVRVKSSQSCATDLPCSPWSPTPSPLTSPPSNHSHCNDCQQGLLLRCVAHSYIQDTVGMLQVSMWMCDLFHFPEGLAHCHDDIREGLVRVVRLVLHTNYPNLTSDGFVALAASPPVSFSINDLICKVFTE